LKRSPKLYETREKVLEILAKLAEELDATVYLFGSYARGDHLLDSDVDVLVVSERFKGLNQVDRVAFVRQRLPADRAFEIIALTPEEMAKNNAFIKSISREWVVVGRKS